MKALTDTKPWDINLPLFQGKVRDVYNFDKDKLLIIATDRLSAFDVILEKSPIPGRGIILTQMTINWFNILNDVINDFTWPIPVRSQIVSTNVNDLPDAFKPHANMLNGRFIIADKCDRLPFEGIVRGYIAGSLWEAYMKAGGTQPGEGTIMILGHEFPRGLQESQELSQPIFTPSTKAETGEHDENITLNEMAITIEKWLETKDYDIDPEMLATVCRDLSLVMYTKAHAYARERGIIIADTKFEYGLLVRDGVLYLVIIDEALTPDSSRFWPADTYQVGRSQPSLDKQIVRDYLAKTLGWDKQPPVPELPEEIVNLTADRYWECATKLGMNLANFRKNVAILFGSANDLTNDIKSVIRAARTGYCRDGRLGRIDAHVISVHRNTPDCLALAANQLEGINLDEIDYIIAAAGWANQLAGMMAAFLHHNGKDIPVIGLAIGTVSSRELEAAKLSIEYLPSHPVVLDESGDAYCNAIGLKNILNRLATGELPPPPPYKEKPIELFVDIG